MNGGGMGGGGGGAGYGQIAMQAISNLGQGFLEFYAAKKAGEAEREGISAQQDAIEQFLANMGIEFDPIWTFVDPLADPAMAGITEDILLSLGQPSGGAGLRGGPLGQVISLAGARGGDIAKTLGGALRRYKKTGQARYPGADDEEAEHIARSLRQAGYTNMKDFFAAQVKWEEEQARFASESEATRQAIREGRFAGFENLARMLTEYPTPLEERGVQEEALYREIERNRSLEEAAIMQAAQSYGFNPAGALGQLAERTTVQREQASANAIVRALQYLEGYNTGITGLTAGLTDPQTQGLNLAQIRTGGLQSLGQVAAAQASAINQINAEIALQEQRIAFNALMGFPSEYLGGASKAIQTAGMGQAIGGIFQRLGSQSQDAQTNNQNQQLTNAMTNYYNSMSKGPATSGTGWNTGSTPYNWY